jgi:hypothetical protein
MAENYKRVGGKLSKIPGGPIAKQIINVRRKEIPDFQFLGYSIIIGYKIQSPSRQNRRNCCDAVQNLL